MVWMSAGILNEIDNVIDTLKPVFLPDAAMVKTTPLATTTPTPLLDSFSSSMQGEIESVVKPVKEASDSFLALYDSKLEELLTGSADSEAPLPQSARAMLNAEENVVEHVEVGVGAWTSSLITMGAVLVGVFIEAARARHQHAGL